MSETHTAPTISVVINTFNEEKNLPFALGSVRTWVDEIVVVDMHSDDRTVEIARGFGAKVFFHERVGFVEPARALALERATGDWILLLDADEMIPFPLSKVLLEVTRSGNVDAVGMPMLHYFFGSPVMHTNCGPIKGAKIRFFRKGQMRASPAIHKGLQLVPGSRLLKLDYGPGIAMIHFAYLDCQDFMEKLDRYTSIEATQALERGERSTPLGALAKAAREFAARYIYGRGFQDGWRGFYISLFYTFYWIVAAAKLQELSVVGNQEGIEALYRQEAIDILNGYGELPASLSNATVGAPASHDQ
ncbi:MAG: glycosyltransferase family 2 protein [Terracidiphilus sp.]